jgi:hypothetical protein
MLQNIDHSIHVALFATELAECSLTFCEGACYLVLVEENKPNEIQQILIERFNCLSKVT